MKKKTKKQKKKKKKEKKKNKKNYNKNNDDENNFKKFKSNISSTILIFCDFSKGSLTWSTDGCTRKDEGYDDNEDDDVIICSCNHLTNFAILMLTDDVVRTSSID